MCGVYVSDICDVCVYRKYTRYVYGMFVVYV